MSCTFGRVTSAEPRSPVGLSPTALVDFGELGSRRLAIPTRRVQMR